MTLSIKHKFQSAKTDGADATLVQPSNWNDGHDLTGSNNILFGTNGSGTGGEITVSTGLSLSSSTLTVAIGSAVQGWDANLDAIAALSGTSGLLKKTNTNTWTLDTTTYQSQITASGLLKGAGSGSISAASAGTDYLVPPSGTSLLKGNSGGALANATAGTDYVAPSSCSIASGKTLTVSNSITLAGTDSTTMTFPGSSASIGYLNVPQVGGAAKTSSYTAVLADSGSMIVMNGASLTATIPANSSVAYPVGTVLTFVNIYAGNLSIAITTDTLTLVNSTTTGTRTLAQNGIATAVKVSSTSWIISGSGLT